MGQDKAKPLEAWEPEMTLVQSGRLVIDEPRARGYEIPVNGGDLQVIARGGSEDLSTFFHTLKAGAEIGRPQAEPGVEFEAIDSSDEDLFGDEVRLRVELDASPSTPGAGFREVRVAIDPPLPAGASDLWLTKHPLTKPHVEITVNGAIDAVLYVVVPNTGLVKVDSDSTNNIVVDSPYGSAHHWLGLTASAASTYEFKTSSWVECR
jgi:hypothetical protein